MKTIVHFVIPLFTDHRINLVQEKNLITYNIRYDYANSGINLITNYI